MADLVDFGALAGGFEAALVGFGALAGGFTVTLVVSVRLAGCENAGFFCFPRRFRLFLAGSGTESHGGGGNPVILNRETQGKDLNDG